MINTKPLRKILLFWMMLGSLLLAQKITQIKFEGLAHLSAASAKEISGLQVGSPMEDEKINEAIKKFYEQGYFKDVWVDRKGGVLIFHFDEKLAVAHVEIKGYGTDDENKKLLEGIGLKKGDLYDVRRIKKAKRRLIAKLQNEGYYDTVIEVDEKPVGESSLSIVFDVNKGEKITIKKMHFIGATKLSSDELEKDLVNKEKDFLGWMPWRNNGEANTDQLEYDAYRLKDTLMQNGYLDADVGSPLMRVDFGSYQAEVDYQVKEGTQYRVGTVGITQSIKGLETKALLKDLTMLSGKVFNVKRMRKDMKNLEEKVGNLGYAFVKVSPQLHKDPERKMINLQYVIEPGNVVTINDVVISGNDATKDRVIRRYIYLAPGDKFNATDLKDSKSALGRTGFFESVDIQSQRITDKKINLLVKVKETPTGTISAGGGYGSYEGVMLNASISDRNLFGYGINTTLGFEISRISKNANLSFVNPKIWDSMYSFGVNIYKRDYEYLDYDQNQLGSSVTLGREFLRYYHGSVGLGYVDNQSTLNDTNTTDVFLNSFLYNDKYNKTSLFLNGSFDNTDDFYIPREGFKAIVNFEYGALGGSYDINTTEGTRGTYDDFIKGSAKFGAYYGLEDWIDYDLILRFKARGTYINRMGSGKLPTAEKLFMGGVGSVRGFDQYSLSPYYLDSEGNRNLVGGTKRASATVEASIPLSEAAKMRLAFFYDYGMISADGAIIDGQFINLENIERTSTGVVLEWQSGFGLINLVFASALDDQPGDRTAVFEFSMGSRF